LLVCRSAVGLEHCAAGALAARPKRP